MNNTKMQAQCTSCKNEEPIIVDAPKLEVKWNEIADSFLMVAFAIGVYSQVFAFFLYAISV